MPIGQELLNVPMGEMIYSMASSIAKSQIELDRASIEVAEMMGGLKTVHDDDGTMRFTDSRVFFGSEYMTVADAMVTQGKENPAVAALIGTETLTYKKYNEPATTAAEGSTAAAAANLVSVPGVELTAENVAAYLAAAKTIKERIGFLEGQAATAAAADVPKFSARITEMKDVQADNDESVANIFRRQVRIPTRLSLLELGFAPTFYQFVDTIIEVKIAITITQETTSQVTTQTDTKTNSVGIGFKFTPFGKGKANYSRSVQTAQVNATYGSKYSHTAEGSSLLRTKLTPLPPPAILEERIRGMMAADQARRAVELGLMTALGAPAAA